MMESILIQGLVGSVITYMVFSRGKNNHLLFPRLNKFRHIISISLCLCIIAYTIASKPLTYYDIIQVDRWAPRAELVQSIRVAKKKYHPDKNKLDEKSNYTELFYEIQKIETVFSSESKRNNYNKYGDFRADGIIEDRNIILCLILGIAFHVYSCLFGLFLSFPSIFRKSRGLFPVYSIAVFCAELHMRLSEDPNPLSFLPVIGGLLPFEKIRILRSLFTCVLIISFFYASNNYRDYDEILNGMLKGNLITNKRIIDLTQSLIVQLQTHGIGSTSTTSNQSKNKKKNNPSSSNTATNPKIKVDSDNEQENPELEVIHQLSEPLKELASTMNESQKKQLQNVLNIAFAAKGKENKGKPGILSRVFGSSFFWIILVGYVFQIIKNYFS
ncbi:DnaJ domain-containing protein [Cryptosporidium ubiquitum]|uniref:DnaJ domain-containing protein n=1 Tax=Cryptosporidium ubiquitum TaxID=857276 RepID=A0A1J4MKE6_9CRYT|nr:DnaJ domain-containing protein [Cryptosporidium ubiquitum]OII74738.1 DnaJ domain-containing protein [Cryptosporidium ubiquitum]